MGFVIRAAGAAFSEPFRERADLAEQREFLLREIEASTRAGFLGAMVRIYMETYVPGAAHTRALSERLRGTRGRLGARWEPVLENLPQFFHPDAAPEEIGARMAAMEDPWNGLKALGLRQPHAPGLMDAAHLVFVRHIAPGLGERAAVERLLHWLKPTGAAHSRQVGGGEALDALLAPWRDRQPGKDLQALLIERIMDFYGHPRVYRAAVWNAVRREHEQVFLRWLTGYNIRLLFRVLTDVELKNMWPDREEFWMGLYERGLIDDVRVAFNTDGYREAIRTLNINPQDAHRWFARQVGEKDKSLLIMRIGGKTVVEGTYSFKVRVFAEGAHSAPTLYADRYDVATIRAMPGSMALAHLGNWQDKVHRMLGT